MSELQHKRDLALGHWSYEGLRASKDDRAAWLASEAEYIKGLIHRAAREPVPRGAKVLQIGAGPCDVIDHWGDGEKHAIDPLAEEYKAAFREFQDPSVNYVAGRGEELPYAPEYFDVIIIRNALDHVEDPHRTLRESFRVLKPSGALYVWTYLYTWYGSWTYRLINLLTKRFIYEPWAFTIGRMKRTLTRGGFDPVLPAIEKMPVYRPRQLSTIYWLKRGIMTVLGFARPRGFTCVALPNKSRRPKWQLPP
jgi:ubiquinone/menaquinone biosynthesis C-methylase UbiE